MIYLIRAVIVVVLWAIYLPVWLIGSKLGMGAVWLGGMTYLFGSLFGLSYAAAVDIGVISLVALVVVIVCRAIAMRIRPPGWPTRAPRRLRLAVWQHQAKATDSPSVAVALGRLPPKLQALTRPPAEPPPATP